VTKYETRRLIAFFGLLLMAVSIVYVVWGLATDDFNKWGSGLLNFATGLVIVGWARWLTKRSRQ
jgi:hypothetical protein